MKILLINYELPPIGGGAGNATWQIARALAKLGHTAVVLTAAFGKRTGPTTEEGVHIHPIPAQRKRPDRSNLFEMGSFVASAMTRAPGIARSLGIEGTIVFFTLPCAPIAFRLKKRLHIPYIISMQGGDVPGFVPALDFLHVAFARLRRSLLAQAIAAVANSQGLKDLSEQSDPITIEVIPNGIDACYYTPYPHRHDANRPFTILFAGRFHDQKNLPLLIKAVGRMTRSAPCSIALHLVGDGPQHTMLRQLAAASGIADQTTWHGWVSKEQLRELYRSADCFVNPSRIEGMPNTVLEAMACGVPVVASDVAGNRELVVDGSTGFLFPNADGDALHERLLLLTHAPERAREFGDNGRHRAVEYYSWERTARAYAERFGRGRTPEQ